MSVFLSSSLPYLLMETVSPSVDLAGQENDVDQVTQTPSPTASGLLGLKVCITTPDSRRTWSSSICLNWLPVELLAFSPLPSILAWVLRI